MSWFSPKISQDDLKRVDRLEETTESLARRMESLVLDLDDFYAKANKARQRVNKEDRDAARAAPDMQNAATREGQKAILRQKFRTLNTG